MGNRLSGIRKKSKKAHVNLKVLILGISGSGKSTFTKQMTILHQGFTKDEIQLFKHILQHNIIIGMQELVKHCEKEDLTLQVENRKHTRYFMEMVVHDTSLDHSKITKKAKLIWSDPAVQEAWQQFSQKQTQITNIDYLMNHIDRIMSLDYVPTKDDIMQARQRTTGQQITTFSKDKQTWELVDVGGQKPERSKWESILMEHQVHAIIYFSGLDEYNVRSVEDKNKTKMQLSIEVFRELLTTLALDGHPPSILLFLNKMDLFRKKIHDDQQYEDYCRFFPTYKGPREVQPAADHIRRCFIPHQHQQQGSTPIPYNGGGREEGEEEKEEVQLDIHTHYTCALDTEAMGVVFQAVKDDIFMQRMEDMRYSEMVV